MCEKKDKVVTLTFLTLILMWPLLRRLKSLPVVSTPRKTSQFIVRCVLILKPSNCKWTVVPLYA